MEQKIWLKKRMNYLQNQAKNIFECNRSTERFGLSLTEEDVIYLLQVREEVLREQQRMEFGEGILKSLIDVFCDSSYIQQDSYRDTIEQLQEIFYLYKNESLDEWTDEELLQMMKENFEGVCQGSLSYLEEYCLDEMARQVRRRTGKYLGGREDEPI